MRQATYQVQYRHLHHALVEVCSAVLDDFDRNNLLRLEVLALDNLAEGALPKHVENEVPIPARSEC
jgi:hypothetical protein